MALADPQTVTINSVAKTLNRIRSENTKSVYQTDDENFRLTISHQETKNGRTRRMARLDCRVVAANPLTSVNEYKELGIYVVIDEPEYGFDDATIDLDAAGFIAWLSQATRLKILASQH